MAKLKNLAPQDFLGVFEDLGVDPEGIQVVDPAPPPASSHKPLPKLSAGSLLYGQIGSGLDIPRATAMYRQRGEQALPADGWALFFLKDQRSDEELARWRNHLWPWLHVLAIYRLQGGRIERQTLQGREVVPGESSKDGVLLVGRRREFVLSPDVTVAKFDTNAAGWNGSPGKPGYAHHRWMRRYVGLYAKPKDGARILDFGCGAGWVGIEAARSAQGTSLCSFDPSPEMVRITGENARANGVSEFTGRTGFGESPPFPAEGEAPFDIVYSSGVVSFSPVADVWTEGLVKTLAAGATLVVGDIQRTSRGFHKRRATRPLLPAREMNALTGDEMLERLQARGFRLVKRAGYQLTWPVPQLAHVSDTRLGGLPSPLFLSANRLLAGRLGADRFDSWVLHLTAP